MPTLVEAFDALRVALRRHFGTATADFEGLTPFHAAVAVVLERELGEKRWRTALDALDDGELLPPDRLASAEIPEITDALRERRLEASPRVMAALKRLGRWGVDHGFIDDGSLETASALTGDRSPSQWREELGSIKGIGPATADAIVLFALNRPSYPVDRATYRVFVRHGWLDTTASYEEARDCLVDQTLRACDDDTETATAALSDLSHGMERIGRQHCRAAVAQCRGCPLEVLLPEGGPREIDA